VTKSYYLDLELNKKKPDQYDIMKEIIRNGPVTEDINTKDKFSFQFSKATYKISEYNDGKKEIEMVKFGKYKSGILKQDIAPDR